MTVTKYYDAALAGLHFDVGFSKRLATQFPLYRYSYFTCIILLFILFHRGIGMNVAGYTEKLPTLLSSIVQDIINPSFWSGMDEQLFHNCRERLLRGLKSCT